MIHSEFFEQVCVSNYIKKMHPLVLFTISPQGMKLPIGVAKRIKAMGYCAGSPDIMIFCPRGEFHALFIEMKRPEKRDAFNNVWQTKGVMSAEQKHWIATLNTLGYKAVVCFSCDDAIKVVDKYLNLGV